MSGTGTRATGLSMQAALAAMSVRLTDAAARAKAALVCAQSGSEREALRIVFDLDEPLREAATLHGAVCLISRLDRAAEDMASRDP